MTLAIRLMATALAVSLAGGPTLPGPDTLGVVTQARDANLGGGPVSPGATLYDGDRLSTQGDGALTLRSATSMLYLSRESRVTLHAIPNNTKGAEADLSAGTVLFSASQVSAMDVCANDAHIRAAANVPTVGQISVTGPKTLYVFASRGALSSREGRIRLGGVVVGRIEDDTIGLAFVDHVAFTVIGNELLLLALLVLPVLPRPLPGAPPKTTRAPINRKNDLKIPCENVL